MKPADKLLTQKQAAALLTVSWWTVREWRYTGKLPWVRLSRKAVRIRESEVERFIQTRSA